MKQTVNLKETAAELRRLIYKMAHFAGGGHLGAAFSVVDLITVLYFGDILHYNPQNVKSVDRDIFILSKGHACYALYAALATAGYFPIEALKNVCKPGAFLGGHPKIHEIPGVEASTGALGHGLSFAIGNALASKYDKKKNHVYVVLGDGECQEGSIWEAALSAATLALDNLTVIVDHNKLQAMDRLELIVNMKPLKEKWEAFGWHVLEIDGHDFTQIQRAFCLHEANKPKLIIANTIKGKGVSFMEGNPIWHYRMPNNEEESVLLKELGIKKEELEVL